MTDSPILVPALMEPMAQVAWRYGLEAFPRDVYSKCWGALFYPDGSIFLPCQVDDARGLRYVLDEREMAQRVM